VKAQMFKLCIHVRYLLHGGVSSLGFDCSGKKSKLSSTFSATVRSFSCFKATSIYNQTERLKYNFTFIVLKRLKVGPLSFLTHDSSLFIMDNQDSYGLYQCFSTFWGSRHPLRPKKIWRRGTPSCQKGLYDVP